MEYHCYTPFQFTQLGSDASWGNMQYFWGAAYHYSGDPTRNAVAPEEGDIDSGFQQLIDMYVSKGIPVLVGEFRAAGKSFLTGTEAAYNSASAHYWNKYLVDSAHVHGLSPFYWSTPGSPFDWTTGVVTDPQVVSVLTGGIAPPPPNGAPYAASGDDVVMRGVIRPRRSTRGPTTSSSRACGTRASGRTSEPCSWRRRSWRSRATGRSPCARPSA